ncbi:MAG: hypothetical protein ACLU5J_12770 [Christensenellales bacterium]
MLSIHDNKIDSTNGVFNIEDTTNNPIKLYNNKIINTDNYIISDSYVFKKNTAIPFLYFALRNNNPATNGNIHFNIDLRDWIQGTNNNILGYFLFPSYLDSLIKATKLRDYVLKGSWVQSRVAYSGDIGTAELNQWISTHDFTIGRYNLSNPAPILVMDYAEPNTDNSVFVFGNVNNDKNILNLIVASANYVFITLYTQFI